jgi:Lhr-like helicase
MSQLDALGLAEALRTRLVDYASSELATPNPNINEAARILWRGAPVEGGLVADLWIEGAFPAVASEDSLRTLWEKNHFPRTLGEHLDKRGAIPADRPLYQHQKEAIQKARLGGERRPVVMITAPTGAGKTESFLLPALDDLWCHPGEPGQGMSALLLYPMNALVLDQVMRLERWLEGQEKITFFHFTSETPEDSRAAAHRGILPRPLPFFRTRKQARGREDPTGNSCKNGRTPDLVVTNYSMLEYMLCRPQDAPFFGKNLRVVVLDEAHVYNGTLAGEIALLLRRLLKRCGVSPEQVLFLATSATIGSGSPEEIRKQLTGFGAQIFSRNPEDVYPIAGAKAPPCFEVPPTPAPQAFSCLAGAWPSVNTLGVDEHGRPLLLEDPQACQQLAGPLQVLGLPIPDEAFPARLLHHALAPLEPLQQTANLLFQEERLPLEKLSSTLWPGQEPHLARAATLCLLGLGASARRSLDELPRLPHRLHVLVRGPEGLSLCLNPGCNGPHKLPGRGALLPSLQDGCPHCGSIVLTLFRCDHCGETVLAARQGADGKLVGEFSDKCKKKTLLFSVDANAKITHAVNLKSGKSFQSMGENRAPLSRVTSCPRCSNSPLQEVPREADDEDEETKDLHGFSSFTLSDAMVTTILAETATLRMPEHPSGMVRWLPARGRRLLAFSDSRREAARLGPRLTALHLRFQFRALLVRHLASSSEQDLDSLQQEMAFFQGQLLQNPNNERARQRRKEIEQTIQAMTEGIPATVLIGDLKKRDDLAEILDLDGGENHTVPWSQQGWEENKRRVGERVVGLLGRELARRSPGEQTLESIGLIELVYPGLGGHSVPDTLLGALPPEVDVQKLEQTWPSFLRLLLDTFRIDGCITLGSEEADRAYELGPWVLGRWMSKDHQGTQLTRFLGLQEKHRRRRFASLLAQRLGVPERQADSFGKELLQAAFAQLLQLSGSVAWLRSEVRQAGRTGGETHALRILFNELVFRKPAQLFFSPRTGQIWTDSVLGLAPALGVDDLEAISHEELDGVLFYTRVRQELREEAGFRVGLWAEEHSAQRSVLENRRVQQLFEAGVRNLLSATTTMELGIDIGGLSGVLLANVPPGRASYLQRAGRAGRRTDGSSVVLAFCRSNSFDRETFHRFGDYLARPGRRTTVILDRERIARRHTHAFLLGEFFRSTWQKGDHEGAMAAFGNMGEFCGYHSPDFWGDGPTLPPLPDLLPHPRYEQFLEFLEKLKEQPGKSVLAALERLLRETPLQDTWKQPVEFLEEVKQRFQQALDPFLEDVKNLRLSYQQLPDQRDVPLKAAARAICKQLDTLLSQHVIATLAEQQFLPRYGFPVGLHRLKVFVRDEKRPQRIREEETIKLERSALLALGEYVPGSRVLVGGKLVTSRGVLRHFVGNQANDTLGLRGTYATCPNEHVSYSYSQDPDLNCQICGESFSRLRSMLLPRHGFCSAVWDPPRWSTAAERVGSTERATLSFNREDKIPYAMENLGGVPGFSALYREDGEIFVYNEGAYHHGFALCTRCGFAQSEAKQGDGRLHLPKGFESHAPLTSKERYVRCWKEEESPVLRNHTLTARETTDILLLDITSLPRDFGEVRGDLEDRALLFTLGQALRIAGARLLEVDLRELGLLPVALGGRWVPALFDNVPGGVGHVRELLDFGRTWLEQARRQLWIDEAHDARCTRACLDCVLTFDSQREMDQDLLQRRQTLALLDAWLSLSPAPR